MGCYGNCVKFVNLFFYEVEFFSFVVNLIIEKLFLVVSEFNCVKYFEYVCLMVSGLIWVDK